MAGGSGQVGSLQKGSQDEEAGKVSEHQAAYSKGLLAMNENLHAVLERVFQHVAASELAQEGVHTSSRASETIDIGMCECKRKDAAHPGARLLRALSIMPCITE